MDSQGLPPPAAPPEHDPTVPTPRGGLQPDELPQPSAPSTHAVETYLPREKPRGVALCLSGGGYRATLFHLGAVRRLNELGILGKINTVTSVSGGSILAGHLAGQLRGWPDPGERIADFDAEVAGPIHRMCQRNIRTLPLLMGLLGMVYPPNWDGHIAVDRLEREYYLHLTKRRLRELPERPRFVFCATDMSYGVNWTFTRDKVGSYMAGYATPPPADWTVARAVAASSCFPPFFNPQPIGLAPGDLKEKGEDKSVARLDRIRGLRLSDGGLYDNMGLEPVWKNHAVVLVSEGGSTFDAGGDLGLFWRLSRYVDVMGRQSGAIRRRWLVAGFVKKVFRGTYWGIGTDAANYSKTAPRYDQKLVNEVIAEVRTDLDKFSEPERFVLENHGYLLADAAITRYAEFLPTKPVPPVTPPHPAWMDSAKVRQALVESHKRKLPFGR